MIQVWFFYSAQLENNQPTNELEGKRKRDKWERTQRRKFRQTAFPTNLLYLFHSSIQPFPHSVEDVIEVYDNNFRDIKFLKEALLQMTHAEVIVS